MSIRLRAVLALGCVSLTALSIPAVSRPNPRGTEPEVRVVIPRAPAETPRAVRPEPTVDNRGPAPRAARPAAAPAASSSSQPLFGWSRLVAEARKYIGTNPTDMQRRWCARFLNLVLAKVGYNVTGSDAARSFVSYGEKIAQPRVGAIAVLTRGRNRNLGHVGVISGFDARGNPIIISGNHGRRVAESVYPRSRVIAYVMPTTHGPRRPVLGRLTTPSATMMARHAPAAPRAPVQQLAARRVMPVAARPAPPRRLGAHDKPAFVAALESQIGRMFAQTR